jgi:AraC-like DNA-binding protein
VTLASTGRGTVRSESGSAWHGAAPRPREPIDTLVSRGAGRAGRGRRELISWIGRPHPAAGGWPRSARGPSSAPRPASSTAGGSPPTGPAPAAGRAEFPDLSVDPDPIYIRDGKYWTSAGVTAGIDLALALVQEDLGVDVAQTVARWLVMFLHRPGGQTQFASPVWVRRAERSTVRAVQTLVEAAPGGDHRVPALAAAAAMSVRHFTRVFTAEVGETPSRFVERVRLEAARRELETTNDTLDVIAARCGFGTAESLRRVFQRRLGVAPTPTAAASAPHPHERTSA